MSARWWRRTLDRTSVVQAVTDAATELTTAEFGAFFYNVVDENGESYTLYTISGVPRDDVLEVPDAAQHRSLRTDVQGTGVVRSDDITRTRATGTTRPIMGCHPATCRCAAISRCRSRDATAR